MTRARCTENRRHRQRGDALLEALIAILLMAAIGLGLAYSAARAINAQRYASTHALALQEMREELERRGQNESSTGLCSSGSEVPWESTLAGSTASFVLQCATANVTVAGTALTVQTLASVATSDTDANRALFGGDGAIVLSLQ